MRALLFVGVAILAAGCLEPLRIQRFSMGASEEKGIDRLVRGFVSQGQTPDMIDGASGVVIGAWNPLNDWRWRYAATVTPSGEVSVRMDAQSCINGPCQPVDGVFGYMQDNLDKFAAALRESVGGTTGPAATPAL